MDFQLQKNEENIIEVKKSYSEIHKEELQKHMVCNICHGKYQLWNKSKHNKSKKHLIAMQELEINRMKSIVNNDFDQETKIRIKKNMEEHFKSQLAEYLKELNIGEDI